MCYVTDTDHKPSEKTALSLGCTVRKAKEPLRENISSRDPAAQGIVQTVAGDELAEEGIWCYCMDLLLPS